MDITPKEVYKEYLKGEMTAEEAAALIDHAIGGITGFEFKKDLKFTVKNHIQKYSLPYACGMRGEDKDKVLELLAVLNTYTNGHSEIHLGEGCSSKHHKDGLNAVINAYAG